MFKFYVKCDTSFHGNKALRIAPAKHTFKGRFDYPLVQVEPISWRRLEKVAIK